MTTKITLTWDNGSSEHVDQIVYRSAETFTVDNLPTILARVGRSAREYIDTGIVTGNVYFYAVASENAVGEVLLSSVISVTAGASTGDPHWDNVVSLLHFDGDLTDSATGSWSGGSTVTTFQSVFGGGSLYVNGNTLLRDTTELLLPLNGDFTFECFVMPISVGSYGGFVYSQDRNSGSTRGANIIIGSGGQLLVSCVGYFELGEQSEGAIPYNEWTHIAATRESNILRLFANGVIVDQKTYSGPLGSTDIIKPRIGEIASQAPGGTTYHGYIDELRITKGVARYTEDFTPPTEPFPNF